MYLFDFLYFIIISKTLIRIQHPLKGNLKNIYSCAFRC